MTTIHDLGEVTATAAKTCRSHTKYGRCGLPAKHGGNHAVPIGGDVWYGYEPGRGGIPLGYGKFVDGQWVAL